MKTKELVLISIFAALTAIGAFIRIPIPYVPFTLQYFFCALSGLILGARLGALSQIVYVGIGLLGIPVFTEGGGIGYIFKPTFGYLIGFILGAYVIGKISERIKVITVTKLFFSVLSGLFFIYLIGVPYLYVIYNLYLGKAKTVYFAVFYGFITCIGGDLVLSLIIALVAARLLPILRKGNLLKIN